MGLYDVLDQITDLLQQRKRLTYRLLKREFALDDETLEDLKDELIKGQRLAVDEDGEVLVWVGDTEGRPLTTSQPARTTEPSYSSVNQKPPPLSYAPQHLTEKILTSRSAPEGERKQVTVMFADIKYSTKLIKDLDPAADQQLLDPPIHIMMDAVHRFEGTVNQVLGDGVMALFGAPVAHEDHAARACYAALAMQAAMRPYADEIRLAHGIEMQIRVGLNSGEVVVRTIGNDLHMDYSAVGPTMHLAARMEPLARPGSIRFPASTLRLVEGFVQVNVLGAVPVKGIKHALTHEVTYGSLLQERRLALHARTVEALEALGSEQSEQLAHHAFRGAMWDKALALADELGMRPLQAHCHRGLGTLYSQKGQPEQARVELVTAIDMYRDMEMTFWLPETEAALVDMGGKV